MTNQQKAKQLGCSVEQLEAQLDRNAKQLRSMARRAYWSGKKVNGYTANELNALADKVTNQ